MEITRNVHVVETRNLSMKREFRLADLRPVIVRFLLHHVGSDIVFIYEQEKRTRVLLKPGGQVLGRWTEALRNRRPVMHVS